MPAREARMVPPAANDNIAPLRNRVRRWLGLALPLALILVAAAVLILH